MARVLAISSHVARGNVGLALTVPALQRFGHEVWPMPTVLLASRPGFGRLAKYEVPTAEFAKMLGALAADGCWESLDGVLTGYFPSVETVEAAAHTIKEIRALRPDVPILVDPILGDHGHLYIAQETAAAIRDQLLPLATITTPNLFELQWLAGVSCSDRIGICAAARGIAPSTAVITSASHTSERVTTLLVTKEHSLEESLAARSNIPNGSGDLFAGLLLGHMLRDVGQGLITKAFIAALADLDPVLASSQGESVLQLSALSDWPL